MLLLIIGLVVFIGIHLIPSFNADLRSNLIDRMGAGTYKGFFALVSLAGFAAIVLGKGQAPFIAIWNPPIFLSIVPKLLMLPAFILLVATYVPSNIKRKVKHPMLAATKLWALAHLCINGDLASILLFGSFLAFGVIAMISANKRNPEPAQAEKKPLYLDAVVVILGVVAYGGVAMHHMQLFGVPIF